MPYCIPPILPRDEALPEHRLIGEFIAVLGTALFLLPTLWLSFADSAGNLSYTVVLLVESLVLLLLGIGVGVRVFVLSGAGLIVVAALHEDFPARHWGFRRRWTPRYSRCIALGGVDRPEPCLLPITLCLVSMGVA